MTLSRRRLLAAAPVAAAAVAAPALLDDGAAVAAPGHYFHKRTATRVPARRWVQVGAVLAGRRRYGVQLVARGGPRVLRVRFVREYPDGRLDGTGDQTYTVGRVSPYNVTHWHEVAPFPGRMLVSVWVDRPVTLRYVIVKARG